MSDSTVTCLPRPTENANFKELEFALFYAREQAQACFMRCGNPKIRRILNQNHDYGHQKSDLILRFQSLKLLQMPQLPLIIPGLLQFRIRGFQEGLYTSKWGGGGAITPGAYYLVIKKTSQKSYIASLSADQITF